MQLNRTGGYQESERVLLPMSVDLRVYNKSMGRYMQAGCDHFSPLLKPSFFFVARLGGLKHVTGFTTGRSNSWKKALCQRRKGGGENVTYITEGKLFCFEHVYNMAHFRSF